MNLFISVRNMADRDMRLLPDDADDERGGVYVPGFHDLVLFDGVCSMCNESVDFLIRNEPLERLLFAPQQDPVAARILQACAYGCFACLNACPNS